jgi:hypothetical protein
LDAITGFKIPFLSAPNQLDEPLIKAFSEVEKLAIDENINRLLSIGAIEPSIPEGQQFVSSIFVVPKPNGSYRLILNVKKLNVFIESEHFKMEDFRNVCNLLKPHCFMSSVDLLDAFHLIPIAVEHRKFLKFRWDGQLYQYTCLPFGLSLAPRLFTKVLRPVIQHLREAGVVTSVYLDDSLIIGDTSDECKVSTKKVVDLFLWLGFFINEKSKLTPCQNIQYLGFIFDTIRMEMSLPKGKFFKIYQLGSDILSIEGDVSIHKLATFIGTIIAAFPAIKYGLLYTKILEHEKVVALQSCGSYKGSVVLSNKARDDIKWWLLDNKKSVRFGNYNFDFTIATDASKSGWGAHYVDKDLKAHGFWSKSEKELHINALEMIAILLSLQTFVKTERNITILLRVDSTSAISYVNRLGGCKSVELLEIARRIWQWAESRNIWLHASYISSKDNFVADIESRIDFKEEEEEWMLGHGYFRKICEVFGQPSLDIFASFAAHHCSQYFSWHPDPNSISVDAFLSKWGTNFYAFPPFCIVLKALNKIRSDRARGIIVVPLWKSQSWYPIFAKMCVSQILILGPKSDLLFCPYTHVSHPLHKSLQLAAAIVSGDL